jgi:hypothetical protein
MNQAWPACDAKRDAGAVAAFESVQVSFFQSLHVRFD